MKFSAVFATICIVLLSGVQVHARQPEPQQMATFSSFMMDNHQGAGSKILGSIFKSVGGAFKKIASSAGTAIKTAATKGATAVSKNAGKAVKAAGNSAGDAGSTGLESLFELAIENAPGQIKKSLGK